MTFDVGRQKLHNGGVSPDEVDFIANMLGALGSPVRVRMALLLANSDHTVNEVAKMLEISQPSASLNLSLLHRTGLVSVKREGSQRRYFVRGPRVMEIIRLALEFRNIHIDNILREPNAESEHSHE